MVPGHIEHRPFRKRWRHGNHVIPLPEFSSNTNPKWPVIVAFSNFSGAVWTKFASSHFSRVACTGPKSFFFFCFRRSKETKIYWYRSQLFSRLEKSLKSVTTSKDLIRVTLQMLLFTLWRNLPTVPWMKYWSNLQMRLAKGDPHNSYTPGLERIPDLSYQKKILRFTIVAIWPSPSIRLESITKWGLKCSHIRVLSSCVTVPQSHGLSSRLKQTWAMDPQRRRGAAE